MATSTFRDRFFTPQVARALTSPSGILATGAGAAAGIVLTAPLSIPIAVVGGLAGAAVGLGGRLLAAMPRDTPPPRIDPFQVQEPWRRATIDALEAKVRFDQAAEMFPPGPLRDAVLGVGAQIESAVEQCWQVARQGDLVTRARARIDDNAIARDLARVQKEVVGDTPNEVQDETLDALRAQAASAGRLDALLSETTDRLTMLNARLDQSVTQAIELSVGSQVGDAESIRSDVGSIVRDLEALRSAMAEVREADRSTTATGAGTVPPPLPGNRTSPT